MVTNSIKRVFAFAFTLFIFRAFSSAQNVFSVEQNIEKGIEAYQNMDFSKAISHFSQIDDSLIELDDSSKALLLFIIGNSYQQIGNINKARILYEKVLNSSPSDPKILFHVRPALLSVYSALKDNNAVTTCLHDIWDIFNDPKFKKSGYYSDYAVALCSYYEGNGQYDKVIDIAQKGLLVIDSEDIDERFRGLQKHTLYMTLGNANRELQEYEQAINNYKNALQYISYTSNIEKSDALSVIGNCFDYAGIPDSALVYLEEAEKLYQEKNSPVERVRVINSLELGILLSMKGECLRAQCYLEFAENGFTELGDNSYLAYVYSHLYNNSNEIGDKELIRKYANQVKHYINNVKKGNGRISQICYSTYASILESEGKQQEALLIMNDVINEEKLDMKTPIYSLSASYSKLANLLMKKGDYIQAETNIRKALELLSPIKDRCKGQYIEHCADLAHILSKTNRVGEAIANLENIQGMVNNVQEYTTSIAHYYSSLSGLYASIGNNENLLKYSILACESELCGRGRESYAYAVSLINLSEAYGICQQKDKADECLSNAAEIICRLYGEDSKEYYDIIHKQALKHIFDAVKKQDSEEHFFRCLDLSKKIFGDNSIEHAEDMCWYGMFLLYTSKDKQGVAFMQNGLDILSSFEGYENDVLFFLSQLSIWCHFFKNYELAYNIDKRYYTKVKQFLSENLPNLVDWQREALWSPIQKNLSGLISAASETHSPQYLKLAYNSLLFGKGLLLQSINNISAAIKRSGNTELIDIHDQIQVEKKKLLNAVNKEEIVKIRDIINSLQRKELNSISQSEILNDIFDIEWTDVCDNLSEGDVAIEFVSYPTRDCNSYVALVLKSNSTEPLCIPLFNDKELDKFYLGDNVEYDYQDSGLYRVIWDRLETYALKNATNVFFAPDGLLHKMAIENLVDKQGKLASEKWNLHRLTSTREIVHSITNSSYKSAALFGGLKYNMEAEDLEQVARLRAGVKNLTETGTEILDIKNILQKKSIYCQVKTGEMGTEESFMALSSTGVNILHLATHGFFWTDKDEKEYKNVEFRTLLNTIGKKESALIRSGLMLSGANVTLQGKKVSKDMQDGILTAQEISSLDFNALDIAVLSACQTALGEVSGEGVFGLQRGFKLAGTQSLLMSLWQVDDYATSLLMTHFYDSLLIKGMTKTEALKNAQQYVKSQPGCEDPEYWAGFILLDALN